MPPTALASRVHPRSSQRIDPGACRIELKKGYETDGSSLWPRLNSSAATPGRTGAAPRHPRPRCQGTTGGLEFPTGSGVLSPFTPVRRKKKLQKTRGWGSDPAGVRPGKTGAPCVKVPGSSRVPAPPWVGSRSPDGWDQIPRWWAGGWASSD